MKYNTEVEIALSRQQVIALFDNPERLREWQPNLQEKELLSETAGQEKARTRLVYQMGKRRVEMIETVTKRDFPAQFDAFYEAKNVQNWVSNAFTAVSENRTRWVLSSEFKCSGIVGLMAFFAPGMFKKQTLKTMQQFKAFAEAAA